MKTSEKYWRSCRPSLDAKEAVEFCLQQLFKDRTKGGDERVAGVCTYEELIGALLLAEDSIISLELRIAEEG